VWLPAVMVWCYLVPFVLAVSLAFPHLAQGLANDPLDSNLKPLQFLIQHGIKPFFIILYALMLANAIRDSKRPELLIISFAVAAILPSILIIQQVLSGADVTNRSSAQGFMAEFGLHPNSYGILFTSCLGPLLFISTGGGQRYLRTIAAIAFFIVSIGIILTASRGAAMAYSIVIVLWLLKRRKLGYLMISVVACLTLLALMPDQVAERLIIGLDTIGEADFAARGDRLTMGRGYVWSTLAPDIWLSPWFGHGIGSTAWNTATTRGINSAGHPHNWYLGILLDMGLLGFCAMMYLFYRLSRKFISLGVESSLPIVIQNFFSGAFVSLVALLAYYVTNGFWWPEPEQTFFWFTLGFAFAYWTRPQLSGLGPSSGRSIRREVAMNGPAPTHGVRR
jgi:O-antigen ligase